MQHGQQPVCVIKLRPCRTPKQVARFEKGRQTPTDQHGSPIVDLTFKPRGYHLHQACEMRYAKELLPRLTNKPVIRPSDVVSMTFIFERTHRGY